MPETPTLPPAADALLAIERIQREERRERLITICLMLSAAIGLQAMHAPESLVGGAIGAAAVLVKSNASVGTTIAASGAGAIVGALLGGWEVFA